MGRYLIRRTLFLILVLFVVSMITFIVFVKLPASDPARRAAGEQTTPENIAAARHAFGLDKPLYVQYGRFAKGLILAWPVPERGRVLLVHQLRPRKGRALRSAAGHDRACRRRGHLLAVAGDPDRNHLGRAAASIWDRSAMVFALIGVSAPTFWLGVPVPVRLLVQAPMGARLGHPDRRVGA